MAAVTARRNIVQRLRAVETDSMWADHGEIPKSWCKEAADEIERLQKIEAAARDLMDNSPIGDNDKPYSSDVAGREFDALYLSLQPQN